MDVVLSQVPYHYDLCCVLSGWLLLVLSFFFTFLYSVIYIYLYITVVTYESLQAVCVWHDCLACD